MTAECQNCGMIDVPLNAAGYCEGCTCNVCGVGGTVNMWGLCSACDAKAEGVIEPSKPYTLSKTKRRKG